MAAPMALGVDLDTAKSALFLCDMQERFRPAIKYFDDIVQVSQRLVSFMLLSRLNISHRHLSSWLHQSFTDTDSVTDMTASLRPIKGRYSNLRHIIHKGLNRLKRTISV